MMGILGNESSASRNGFVHVLSTSLLALGFLAVTAGCPDAPTYLPRSSGSIGLSSDDKALFVADADHDRINVIDTESGAVVAVIPVGRRPERVLVGPDDSVYVSLRGERAVVRISSDLNEVLATGHVGAEPVGLALTMDGRLLVANQASGTVSILDAHTLENSGEIEVGGNPMAVVALAGDEEAYVTDYLSGSVTVVDISGREVTSRVHLGQPGLDEYECDNGVAAPRTAALPADVVLSPDGRRAYVAHVQSRTGTEPGAEVFGQPSLALAVAPAMGTLDTYRHTLMAEPQPGQALPSDHPAPLLVSTDPTTCFGTLRTDDPNMDAPSSLVVDSSGEWIYVADHNSNAMAIVSARRRAWPSFVNPERGIADVVAVGARPTGIAVRSDLTAAYVHNAFDYDVSVVERVGDRLTETRRLSFDAPTLDAVVERGRRLFYSAVDPRMTEPTLGGVSCSSCHPDGRTDGLTWVLPDGVHDAWRPTGELVVRGTPPLWGIGDTAPYLREGSLADLPSASHLMVDHMGGLGLGASEMSDVTAYLRTIETPDNPHRDTVPAELQAAGAAVFAQRCGACHAGDAFTDGNLHRLSVGLDVVTPSLRGAFAAPPYFHDGSVRSLSDAIDRHSANVPGSLSTRLTTEEKKAVEAYLKTL